MFKKIKTACLMWQHVDMAEDVESAMSDVLT